MRRLLFVLLASFSLVALVACGGGSAPAEHTATETAAVPEAGAATDQATAPTETPSDEPPANTIRWQTASEVDNFGYDVYRAETEEGPFERVTEEPIPGAGTTDSPTKYSFVDDKIDPTKAYWYYVESISMSNERERFTPIIRAKPKRPVEGDDGEAASDSGDEG